MSTEEARKLHLVIFNRFRAEYGKSPSEAFSVFVSERLADFALSERQAGMLEAAQMAEDANVPAGFRNTGIYDEFERGGDEYLTKIAAAIRQRSKELGEARAK